MTNEELNKILDTGIQSNIWFQEAVFEAVKQELGNVPNLPLGRIQGFVLGYLICKMGK